MTGRTRRTEMDVADALRVLGVEDTTPWVTIRKAYRDAIRRVHPDVDPSGDATARAARLNEAFAVLDEATASGARPIPVARSDAQRRASSVPEPLVVLRAPAGDVFISLLEAAYDVGDVCYVDPEAGLIQVLLGDDGPSSSQLLISVDVDSDPPSASFTLDSMDAETAPDIHTVVADLAACLAQIGQRGAGDGIR